ncbi:hypothetical protein AYL99_11603 [Fonsecaea erecta]|uniref:Uncharacterized protein n=1 Tax=Fonsecaea erecta TaxID=1367422 RepID=A0A178Z2P1_9EURO|nr:hypothetical protein AYL99_11603 [Fonsecaea erecta]OAP54069.1 hypothetical protein AYL99_11603 [Fonsecaea erecta]
MEAAWNREWAESKRASIYSKMTRLINEASGDPTVDPAMYTTMPLDDMIDHPGGEMYDTWMLKPRSYLTSAISPVDLLERAVVVVSRVEELDSITFTSEERLAVAVFFAFASRKTDEIISDDMIGVMQALQVDWSTSVTCRNIVCMKSELRKGCVDGSVDMSTDISSLLGVIAFRNMCKFAPFASSKPGARACQERDEGRISY